MYVAVTRTRNIIHIPESLIPLKLAPSSQVNIIRTSTHEQNKHAEMQGRQIIPVQPKENAGHAEPSTKKKKGAYPPWTKEIDEQLTIMYCEGATVQKMAKHLGRTEGAINLRIKKLELAEIYR